MDLEIIKVGYLKTNCYILSKNNKAIIIDPGDEGEKIVSFLKKKKLDLCAILITHTHFDHVGAIEDVIKYKEVPIFINLDEKEYNIDYFNFEVIRVYGHTNDSIIYYFKKDKIMFVGDFIFKNGIGRTDLPTGSYTDMIESIKKIQKYDDDIIIYPGHGDSTILGIEKKNIYFT